MRIRNAMQRAVRGYGDDDIWDLDICIAQFVLPRLKAFAECEGRTSYVGTLTPEEWQAALAKMIRSFELVCGDYPTGSFDEIQVGLDLFAKYYTGLWL